MGFEPTTLLLAQDDGGQQLINWTTVIAQIVNFLILVLLLRFVLYKRIVQVIDRRQQKIASHFEAAQEKQDLADRREAELKEQQERLEEQRQQRLEDARSEAEELRKKLTDEARREVDELSRRWRDGLQRRQDAFLQRMAREVGQKACHIARRALDDLAGADLEGAIVARLAERLGELDDQQRRRLGEAIEQQDGHVTAAAAFELDDGRRKQLADALGGLFDREVHVDAEPDDRLICGVELRAGGQEVAWSVDGYLHGVRDALQAALEEQAHGSDRPPGQSEEPRASDRQEEGPSGGQPGDEGGQDDGEDPRKGDDDS
jgi:F-type H+-transporting ATPase subunit b